MATTRVFLTGGTGHVGGALLALLRDDPTFEVVALTRREPPADEPGVTWVRGDLADAGDVSRAAKGCAAAFLVWPFGDASGAPPGARRADRGGGARRLPVHRLGA